MKKLFTLLFLFVNIAIFTGLSAQSELPKKRPTEVKPQTGGPQGSRPAENRPVYRPRPVNPMPPVFSPYPNYPVFQGSGMGNNNPDNGATNNPGPSAEEIAKYNRTKAQMELKKVLWEMQAQEQAFDIKDVTRPFEIVGVKGFKVAFPELAFVDAEGHPVLGEVELRLVEFTDNSEFAAANLTTLTTDGLLLETGGMINIEAFSGDKKVQLQQGKSIEITVPELKDQKGFQTFYANGRDMVTWSTSPTNNASDTASEKPFDGYTIKMVKSTQTIQGNAVNFSIFKNWQSLEEYVNANLKVPGEVRKNIKKDGIPFLYTIEFNALGRIKEVKPKYPEYTKNSLISEMNGKIKAILMDAPALALSDGNLESGRTYDIMFATAKNYTESMPFPISMPMAAGREGEVSAMETNANPSEKNVNDFAMQGSQLTKINCDRFVNSNSKDTQHFHFERADAIVYVVFKDMRSFIQPSGANGDYLLKGVPSGSNVRYVAVIYGDDGSIKMATKDTRTEHGDVKFEEMTAFSAEGLKAALNP